MLINMQSSSLWLSGYGFVPWIFERFKDSLNQLVNFECLAMQFQHIFSSIRQNTSRIVSNCMNLT